MTDIDPALIAALLVIVGGIGFLVWYGGRKRRFREYRREDEVQREKRRQKDMASLDPPGKLLYQLVENTSGLMDVQQYQSRKLGDISTATTIIAVLLVLSVIVGCLAALFGWSLSGLV